jgi:hypothetical protein
MDVTLDSHPGTGPTVQGIQQSGVALRTAPTEKKSSHRLGATIGLIVAAILLAGGWYGYAHRGRIEAILDPNSAPETAEEVEPSGPAQKTAKTSQRANREPRKENFPTQPGKSATKTSEIAKPAVIALPAPPRVDFDPKQLDPNANAKLKIEADHFPENVAFTVEMGGKIYFERGGNNNQNLFEDLYVPPGVTEFRVIAGVGTNRKTSNIVSDEFKAKKKKTLRIELRTQGQKPGSGVPAGVYSDSQIVVTLK